MPDPLRGSGDRRGDGNAPRSAGAPGARRAGDVPAAAGLFPARCRRARRLGPPVGASAPAEWLRGFCESGRHGWFCGTSTRAEHLPQGLRHGRLPLVTFKAMESTIHDIRGADHPLDKFARPLHDLRISVMDRCNFRCPYCMPKQQFHDNYRFLKSQERLSFEEIVRLSRLFASLGVRKLRLTGGEPLLRANLSDLVGDLTDIPGIDDIALTTNGVLLGQHAVDLHANGLRRVTVSLDTLDKEIFARMSGGFAALDQVLHGIDAAVAAGLTPVKINAVIERGVNDHTALDLVERFRGKPVIVRFIEFMDVGNRNEWRPEMVVPSRELAARISARWPMHPVSENYRGEVAQRWRFDDGAGDADLLNLIRGKWLGRTDHYSEQRNELRRADPALKKIEMYYIGG